MRRIFVVRERPHAFLDSESGELFPAAACAEDCLGLSECGVGCEGGRVPFCIVDEGEYVRGEDVRCERGEVCRYGVVVGYVEGEDARDYWVFMELVGESW